MTKKEKRDEEKEDLGSDQERGNTAVFIYTLGTACFAPFMLQIQMILMLLSQNEIKEPWRHLRITEGGWGDNNI